MTVEIRDKRSAGWCWINNAVLKVYGQTIGSTAIATYVALSMYADNDAQDCYPAKGTLAELIGVTAPTVDKALKKLEGVGLIDISPRFDEDGRRTSNLYTLLPVEEEENKNFLGLEKKDTLPGHKKNTHPRDKNFARTRLNEQDSSNYNDDAVPKRHTKQTPERRQEDAMEKAVVDFFKKKSGLRPRGSEYYVRWYDPARELLHYNKWDVEKTCALVTAAYKRMKGDGLTMNSIESIMKVAMYLMAEKPDEKIAVQEW